MHSMTGYGRGSAERSGRGMTVELKSVNHRFLDLSFRMPRALNALEDAARRALTESLARGHVDLYASYQNVREDGKAVRVDRALLAAYRAAILEIAEATGTSGDVSAPELLRLDGVTAVSEADEDIDALRELMEQALGAAIASLRSMRGREGAALAADLSERLDRLEQMTGEIEARYPATIAEYTAKLKARVAELLGGAPIDEGRLMQEVALMADRSAIAEETVRLRSHIAQFRALLGEDEPVGRKLDFLVQELNREVNTISSKSQDVSLTRLVVAAKAEIEKMREQVQNIE